MNLLPTLFEIGVTFFYRFPSIPSNPKPPPFSFTSSSTFSPTRFWFRYQLFEEHCILLSIIIIDYSLDETPTSRFEGFHANHYLLRVKLLLPNPTMGRTKMLPLILYMPSRIIGLSRSASSEILYLKMDDKCGGWVSCRSHPGKGPQRGL
jgi:hypothetical protein